MKHNQILILALCAVMGACEKPDSPGNSSDIPDGPAMNPSISSVTPAALLLYPSQYGLCDTVTVTAQYADTVYVKCCPCIGVKQFCHEGDSWQFEVRVTDELSEAPKFAVFAENADRQVRKDIDIVKAVFSPDKESCNCPAAGATVYLSVDTNVGLKVLSQGPEWIHIEDGEDYVGIKVDRNEGFTPRSGDVILSDSRSLFHRTFTVSQDAAVDYYSNEKAALEALWEATGGKDWKSLSNSTGGKMYSTENWCTDYPIETWYGVTLNPDGHVIYLHLTGVGLKGSLPEEIGDLAYLQELWLSGNDLSGTLPQSIGNLKVLKDIDLSGMSLTGKLEDSTLGDIAPHLKSLSLSGNLFTGGFPEWIGDVPEAANFWLQGNCLEGTVPEKVKAHPRWDAEAMDGTGRTIGEINMEQREGFVLK